MKQSNVLLLASVLCGKARHSGRLQLCEESLRTASSQYFATQGVFKECVRVRTRSSGKPPQKGSTGYCMACNWKPRRVRLLVVVPVADVADAEQFDKITVYEI